MIQKEYSFIKLKPEQAVILRKNVLTLEMDLLQLVQRIANYKAFKKSENQYRVMLRKALEESAQDIRTFYSNVPQFQAQKSEPRKVESRHRNVRVEKRPLHRASVLHRTKVSQAKKPVIKRDESLKSRLMQIREREQAAKQKDASRSHIEDKLREIKRRLADLGVGS